MMSSELDILIVGHNDERFSIEIRQAFRHWQVYSAANPGALHGRKFRRAYVTTGASQHPSWNRLNSMLVAACELIGGEILPFSTYRPEFDVQTYEDSQLARAIARSRYAAGV